MNKLFIQNFKGFEKEIIELKDVNFLVGQNSTGKTSILKLINILSSNEFWFNTNFNNNDVELGYFDEIKTKNSKENSFTVGFERITESNEPKKEKKIRVLIEFIAKQNVPELSKVKLTKYGKDYIFKVTPKQLKYKELKHLESFREWVEDFSIVGKTKIIRLPFKNVPFPMMINLLERELSNTDEKHNSTLFNFNIYGNSLYQRYTWIAPIRAKAKRIYESYKSKYSPEGEHVPSLLRKIYSTNSKTKTIKAIKTFGVDCKLFDNIKISDFGKKNSSPFKIQVLYDSLPTKITNVGYGVSQALPIIVELASTGNECFSIQQPEVHLHPKAQAAFGSFIFNNFKENTNNYLIETHSDFTINRFRFELSNSLQENIIKPKTQVLFFHRKNNKHRIEKIDISENGSYSSHIPIEYREFFIDEELKLLEL